MSPTRVYLIDDHPIVREGLSRIFKQETDMELVGSSETAAAGLRETLAAKPDVILVDLNMPDRDGIELLSTLHAQLPAAKLVVLSGYEDEYRVAEALRAGAQGYLVKSALVTEVVDGIRHVMAGGAPLSPRVAGAVVRAMRRGAHSDSAGGIEALTPRELQVLRLLAAGVSTRETAQRLTISPKTVETHRVRIYSKLGVKSAVELTRVAVRMGLIDP